MDARYPGVSSRSLRVCHELAGESPDPFEAGVIAGHCCFGWSFFDRLNVAPLLSRVFCDPVTPELVVILLEKYLPITRAHSTKALSHGYCKELAFLKLWDEGGLKQVGGLGLGQLRTRCDAEALYYTRANPKIDFEDSLTEEWNPKFARVAARNTARQDEFKCDLLKPRQVPSLEMLARRALFSAVHTERWPEDTTPLPSTIEDPGRLPSVLLPRIRSKSCGPAIDDGTFLLTHHRRNNMFEAQDHRFPYEMRRKDIEVTQKRPTAETSDSFGHSIFSQLSNANRLKAAFGSRPATRKLCERGRNFLYQDNFPFTKDQ